MTNPVAVLTTTHYRSKGDEESHPVYREVRVWCPGCRLIHHFTVEILDPTFNRGDGKPLPVWNWDGNLESPTFSPSLLCYNSVHLCEDEHKYWECENPDDCMEMGHIILNDDMQPHRIDEPEPSRRIWGHGQADHPRNPAWGNCHSFVRNGHWQFLNDCAHKLAGKTVPLPPLPDWVVK